MRAPSSTTTRFDEPADSAAKIAEVRPAAPPPMMQMSDEEVGAGELIRVSHFDRKSRIGYGSASHFWRGGRVVECAGFENRSARKGSGSSNLPLSVKRTQKMPCFAGLFCILHLPLVAP